MKFVGRKMSDKTMFFKKKWRKNNDKRETCSKKSVKWKLQLLHKLKKYSSILMNTGKLEFSNQIV